LVTSFAALLNEQIGRETHGLRHVPGYAKYLSPKFHATLYGTQMAERLGRELAARGLVIVSGLARGIDAISHQGALAVNGRAIGVLGTGVDVYYPKENRKLYDKVLERGAILSEFPLGTHPAPENFPIRNRIVAGLPLGVVIVEGRSIAGR
jgi:DNA processing protein